MAALAVPLWPVAPHGLDGEVCLLAGGLGKAPVDAGVASLLRFLVNLLRVGQYGVYRVHQPAGLLGRHSLPFPRFRPLDSPPALAL